MKKLLVIIAALAALALPVAASAETTALPDFDITVNGEKIDNSVREYPFVVYNNITYFPMTFYDCRFLGLETTWSQESGLRINKTDITSIYFPNPRANAAQSLRGQRAPFPIAVNGRLVDNSSREYPMLLINDVTYFPLTWEFCHDEFGWDYSFGENGLIINSDNITFEKYELDIPDMEEDLYMNESQMDSRYIAISKGRVYYLDSDGVYSYIPGETEPEYVTEHVLSIGSSLYSYAGDIYYSYMYPSERTSQTTVRLTTLNTRISANSQRWTSVGFSAKDGYIFHWKTFMWYKSYYLVTQQGEEITVDENISHLDSETMLIVRNNKLYYIADFSSGRGNLYSMDLTTNEKKLLVENVSVIADADGNKIYFGADRELRVYDITTGEYNYLALPMIGPNRFSTAVKSVYALGNYMFWINDEDKLLQSYRDDSGSGVKTVLESDRVKSVRCCGDGYLAFTFWDDNDNFTKTIVFDRSGSEVLNLGLEVSELSVYDDTVMFFHDETGAVYRGGLSE